MKPLLYYVRILKVMLITPLIVSSSFVSADIEINDRQLVEQLNQNWNNLFNSGDAHAVAQLYSETAILSPGNGQALNGRVEIETLFKSFVDNGVHAHQITVIDSFRDGNTLYQISNWSASGKEQEGVIPSFGGIVTLISKLNEQGEWKVQLHSWNLAN
ncbi:MAG: DUF4440 domain-containing protein [Piscirickettsiaceae bacterium]|nr:DUF4440 domain-containing protein [Piscirickettsiaceae bacterium]